jgi:hypothetical protein
MSELECRVILPDDGWLSELREIANSAQIVDLTERQLAVKDLPGLD